MNSTISCMALCGSLCLAIHGNADVTLVQATAYENYYGDVNENLHAVQAVDGLLAPLPYPEWVDYFACGSNRHYWDGLSLLFEIEAPNPEGYILRLHMQKADYVTTSWEHFQVVPGWNNDNFDDYGTSNPVHPHQIDIYPEGELPNNHTHGWVQCYLDPESNPNNWFGNQEFGFTLRLWNLRVDAVELIEGPNPCIWDVHPFNTAGVIGDSTVGSGDFFALLQNWGSCPEQPAACPWDVDGDHEVGLDDFFALLQHWGPCEG